MPEAEALVAIEEVFILYGGRHREFARGEEAAILQEQVAFEQRMAAEQAAFQQRLAASRATQARLGEKLPVNEDSDDEMHD